MNLSGVLSPKAWISNLLLASFLLIPANARIAQKTEAVEQTSFSMEFPFEQSVPLSEAAKKALATDSGIADVMKDDQLSIGSIPKDWFTASEVHLGPKSETDLVVMGLRISLGPYSAGFWILRQTPQGYEIVLAVHTHNLALLDSSTNGFRDIETGLPTLGQSHSDIYRFDGHRYQMSPLTEEIQSSRVPKGTVPPTTGEVEAFAKRAASEQYVGKEVRLPDRIFKKLVAGAPVGYPFCHAEDRNVLEAHQILLSSNLLGGLAIQGRGGCFCSPTGNCEFWIYQLKNGKYRAVLRKGSVQTFGFLKSRTHGYPDLVTWSHGSATQTGARLFRFDGNRYAASGGWDVEFEYLGDDGQIVKPDEPRITSHFSSKDELPKEVKR
jgi:hypothetical protein